MRVRPPIVAVALLASGVALAACGGPSRSAASSSTTTRRSTTTSTSSTTTTSTTSSTTTTAPPPSTTTTAALALCRSAHLSVSQGTGQGAAGHVAISIVFTNTGTTTCTLQGYPGVSYVGANGVQIGPAAQRGASPGPLVTVAPGHQATVWLMELDPLLYNCTTPVGVKGFRVYPPNQTGALFLPFDASVCPDFPAKALTVYQIGAPPTGA